MTCSPMARPTHSHSKQQTRPHSVPGRFGRGYIIKSDAGRGWRLGWQPSFYQTTSASELRPAGSALPATDRARRGPDLGQHDEKSHRIEQSRGKRGKNCQAARQLAPQLLTMKIGFYPVRLATECV